MSVIQGKQVDVRERKYGRKVAAYEIYLRAFEERKYPPTPTSPDGFVIRTVPETWDPPQSEFKVEDFLSVSDTRRAALGFAEALAKQVGAEFDGKVR